MELDAKLVADHMSDPPPHRVLDIAASHGLFGIAFGRRFPDCRVTGLDWGAVVAVARENADAAGMGDRYDTIVGSAFDVDWGTGYDVVLLPNFLHHFDRAGCMVVRLHTRFCCRCLGFKIPSMSNRCSATRRDWSLFMLLVRPAPHLRRHIQQNRTPLRL